MQNSPLPYSYVKEQINRQNKFIYVFDTYQPDATKKPVTSKFWTKHEAATVKPGQETQLENYKKMVQQDLLGVPKDRYPQPMVESHKYVEINASNLSNS